MELENTLHLQQQIARLQALLEASHKIHSTIELDSVLRAVLELSVRELEMAGAFFHRLSFFLWRDSAPLSAASADIRSETRLFSLFSARSQRSAADRDDCADARLRATLFI